MAGGGTIRLSDSDRAVLATRMSPASKAALLGRSAAWVGRAMAAIEAAAVAPAAPIEQPPPAAPAQRPSAEPQAGPVARLVAFYGAPAGLEPRALAGWLYDNSPLSFAQIAAAAGVDEAEVRQLADGEAPAPPEVAAAVAVPAPIPAPPPPARANPTKRQPPAETSTAAAFVSTPVPFVPRPAAVARRGVALRLAPLTPAKRRYCGWFIAAGWAVNAVAELFDVDPVDVATAFGGRVAS
jgi:hypothetical protein